MGEGREATGGGGAAAASASDLLEALVDAGHLIPTGTPGLYGRGAAFDALLDRLEALFDRLTADDRAERLRFPPAIGRALFERSGYLDSFPHLAGTVHAFDGDERGHRELLAALRAGRDWTGRQAPTGLVLTPAACYPVYPIFAARGPLPATGGIADVASWCFRHEPSTEPTRLQLFRMREQVRLGRPEQVLDFRQRWIERARQLVDMLDLPARLELAHDPFFGRGGQIMAASQRDQRLKFELVVPIADPQRPTACMSFNYHQDHFARSFGIRDFEGAPAHTACVGFGVERLAMALLRHHGLDPTCWPARIRAALEAASP
ncbi:MAG: amino acid--[acyl-carrier-protein] ligase [Geminicoccaceae bacterium]|nr:amino acid--[acyl-carrier-protein] ligase [Geminicoccaceae bacterium]